jgi:hypothetical protein
MGAIDELGLKPGVIYGDDVLHVLFLIRRFPFLDTDFHSSLNMLANINSPFPQS